MLSQPVSQSILSQTMVYDKMDCDNAYCLCINFNHLMRKIMRMR
jgi:hypothetical protein